MRLRTPRDMPPRVHRWIPPWRLIVVLAGFGALFSGAALVTNSVAGISLPLALALIATPIVVGLAVALRRSTGEHRRRLLRIVSIGAGSGVVATIGYDSAKYVLEHLDPSPYNPFEATVVFGTLLFGSATHPLVVPAGWAFHVLNGTCFGLAYCLLLARRGRTSVLYASLSGIGWGLFLEMFQLLFYPEWLGIVFLREFQQISAASHFVYGLILGLTCRFGLRRWDRTRG